MIGKLTIDKASMNISYFLNTLNIIHDYGGSISRKDFVNEMAKFMGTSPVTKSGKENRTPYNKSKLPRYFGFVDSKCAPDNSYLVLTNRGKKVIEYIHESPEEEPDLRYSIMLQHRMDFIDLIFESVIFDSFGKNNCGAEQSNTDVEPPKVVFKTLLELKEATADEIFYIMYGLNEGELQSFDKGIEEIKRNRKYGTYKYDMQLEKWGITNIAKDCKIIKLFTDPSIKLIYSEYNEEIEDVFYKLDYSIDQKKLNQIKNIDVIYQPLRLFVYSDSESDMLDWIYNSVLGDVSDRSFVFNYDSTKKFLGELEEGEFTPGVFDEALVKAYKNPDKNIYIVFDFLSEEKIYDKFGKYKSLLIRKNNLFDNEHGWSSNAVIDYPSFNYIHSKVSRYGKFNKKGEVRIPGNIQIVGTDIMENIENKKIDYEFTRCVVHSDKKSNVSLDNIDESKRVKGACNILLYGVPGSGKSHTIKTQYCNNYKFMERVIFHPDYINTDFIGQILPTVKRDSNDEEIITYQFTPGPFTRILKKAIHDPEQMYYLVIEEINRGNASAICGEVFQLLDREPDGRSSYEITNDIIAKEVYGDESVPVYIPSNLTILSTMNTADQNVFVLDTAFQRRWDMKMIKNDIDNAEHAEIKILDTTVMWKTFNEVINRAILTNNNDTLSSEDKRLGAYFVTKDVLIYNDSEQEHDEPLFGAEKKCTAPRQSNNDRFGEKVIKYLWDDAFKFSRKKIFNEKFDSLEMIITFFNSVKGDKRFDIFEEEIKNELIKKVDSKEYEEF